jgi:AcrR family transcriptional regulator
MLAGVRSAAQTRARLLGAATAEFSRHGIAGARVDRIAQSAGCNKALIYTYFGSKDQLFGAVMAALVSDTVAEVPITPEDLPGYAAALFDRCADHPELLRLATWQRLELTADAKGASALDEYDEAKVRTIRGAQRRGLVRADIGAPELLVLVIGMSVAAALHAPGLALNNLSWGTRRRHRAALSQAVSLLVRPAH